jgi:tetratricopeptide (TPR) repeat protein
MLPDVLDSIKAAEALLSSGDAAGAETRLGEALARDAGMVSALLLAGRIAARRDDHHGAFLRFAAVASLLPLQGNAVLEAARALLAAGRPADAVEWLLAADARLAGGVDVPSLLAQALSRAGRVEEALACWAGLRRDHPGHLLGYTHAAEFLQQAGRLDEARELSLLAIQTLPENYWGYHRLAAVEDAAGQFDAALACWQQACMRFPTLMLPHLYQGQLLLRMGRAEEARGVFAATVERFPLEIEPIREWAWIEERRGDWREAGRLWGLIRERFPGLYLGFTRGAHALQRAGDFDAAHELLDQATRLFPDRPEPWVERAEALHKVEQADQALLAWRDLRLRFPAELSGHLNEAEILREQGDYEGADAVLADAEQSFTASPWPRFQRGVIAVRRPDLPAALDFFRATHDRFPAPALATIDTLLALGRLDEADLLVGQVLQRPSAPAELQFHALKIAEQRSDLPTALTIWRDMTKNKNAGSDRFFSSSITLFSRFVNDPACAEILEYLLVSNPAETTPAIPPIVKFFGQLPSEVEATLLRERIWQIYHAMDHNRLSPRLRMLLAAISRESLDAQYFNDFLHRYISGAPENFLPIPDMFYVFSQLNAQTAIITEILISYSAEFLMRIGDRIAENSTEAFCILLLLSGYLPDEYIKFLEELGRDGTGGGQEDAGTAAGLVQKLVRLNAASHREEAWVQRGSPALAQVPRRLKIAICVSGQLRGYLAAHESWRHLGLDTHDVVTCVHTWEHVGRKMPGSFDAAERCFSRHFLASYKDVILRWGGEYPVSRYPALMQRLGEDGRVSHDILRAAYGNAHIEIEDDRISGFNVKSNAWKMYYKIDQVHRMARLNCTDADLFMRIRPDREVLPGSSIDWQKIYFECMKNNKLFCDSPRVVSRFYQLMMGDQFAVSTPQAMDHYAAAFKTTQAVGDNSSSIFGFPRQLNAHQNIAFSTLYGGVDVRMMPALELGRFFNPPVLEPHIIMECLQADCSGRPLNEVDEALFAALQADLA